MLDLRQAVPRRCCPQTSSAVLRVLVLAEPSPSSRVPELGGGGFVLLCCDLEKCQQCGLALLDVWGEMCALSAGCQLMLAVSGGSSMRLDDGFSCRNLNEMPPFSCAVSGSIWNLLYF